MDGMGEGMRGNVEWGGGRGLFLENKNIGFFGLVQLIGGPICSYTTTVCPPMDIIYWCHLICTFLRNKTRARKIFFRAYKDDMNREQRAHIYPLTSRVSRFLTPFTPGFGTGTTESELNVLIFSPGGVYWVKKDASVEIRTQYLLLQPLHALSSQLPPHI
jgi:hypothetical protein